MNNNSYLKILFNLEELKRPIKLSNFLEINNIVKNDFLIFIEKSYFFGITLNLENMNDEQMISPLSWSREFGDLFLRRSEFKEIAYAIQDCIESKEICKIYFLNSTETVSISPWKIILLEDILSLIGEDIYTQRLLTISLSDISEMERDEKLDYKPLFSKAEIEEFISAARSIIGKEKRLILKIKHGNEIILPNSLIYFGNTYTVMNSDGEMIWAASIEESSYLYEWLLQIRSQVEIIEPTSIKKEIDMVFNKSKIS